MIARRRGFTLIEVVLAAVLGSIVMLAAMSMFATLRAADQVGQEAYDEATQAAFTHEIITKSLQTLMMSNTVAPPRNARGERVRPGEEGQPLESSSDPRFQERPRLLLESDETLPPVMLDPASQNADLMHPQRLEVALRARPLFVFGVELETSAEEVALLGPAGDPDSVDAAALDAADRAALGPDDQTVLGGRRNSRPSGLGRGTGDDARRRAEGAAGDPLAEDGSAADRRAARELGERGALAAVTTELVQGVRGAFEFEFDPGVEAGGTEPQAGWVLWWRQIYPAVEPPADLEPGPTQRVGSTRLMGNIQGAAWHVLYTKRRGAGQRGDAERLREHAAVWFDDLPGYIELDIITNTGSRHQWTFEVSWGVSGEPGTVASVSPAVGAAQPAAGGAGANRAQTPTATEAAPGGGASDRGRRSGSGRSSGTSGSSGRAGSSKGNGENRR